MKFAQGCINKPLASAVTDCGEGPGVSPVGMSPAGVPFTNARTPARTAAGFGIVPRLLSPTDGAGRDYPARTCSSRLAGHWPGGAGIKSPARPLSFA